MVTEDKYDIFTPAFENYYKVITLCVALGGEKKGIKLVEDSHSFRLSLFAVNFVKKCFLGDTNQTGWSFFSCPVKRAFFDLYPHASFLIYILFRFRLFFANIFGKKINYVVRFEPFRQPADSTKKINFHDDKHIIPPAICKSTFSSVAFPNGLNGDCSSLIEPEMPSVPSEGPPAYLNNHKDKPFGDGDDDSLNKVVKNIKEENKEPLDRLESIKKEIDKTIDNQLIYQSPDGSLEKVREKTIIPEVNGKSYLAREAPIFTKKLNPPVVPSKNRALDDSAFDLIVHDRKTVIMEPFTLEEYCSTKYAEINNLRDFPPRNRFNESDDRNYVNNIIYRAKQLYATNLEFNKHSTTCPTKYVIRSISLKEFNVIYEFITGKKKEFEPKIFLNIDKMQALAKEINYKLINSPFKTSRYFSVSKFGEKYNVDQFISSNPFRIILTGCDGLSVIDPCNFTDFKNENELIFSGMCYRIYYCNVQFIDKKPKIIIFAHITSSSKNLKKQTSHCKC